MRIIRSVVLGLIAVVAAAQVQARVLMVTGQSFQQILPGMAQAQVEEIVGRPERFRTAGNQVVWSYLNKCLQFLDARAKRSKAYFHVIFTNGLVTASSAGEIRQSNANVLYIFGF